MENNQSIPTNNAIISAGNFTSTQRDINELISTPMLSNNNNDDIVDEVISFQDIDVDYFNSFPPGYRFYPTDAELVTYYLKRKLDNVKLPPNKIYEINIYRYNPDVIAANIRPTTEEKVWYILTPRNRKYRNGKRPNRAAGDGYWKATGADKQIKDNHGVLIGLKKALVFYIGKPPRGEKTDWIMHEYRAPDVQYLTARDADDMRLDDWVLCSIYKKSERDNTMFNQRKRTRDEYDVLVQDVDGQVREDSNENMSSELANTFEAGDDSTKHESTNYTESIRDSIDMLRPNKHISSHPQVPTRFANFPRSFPTFGNIPGSTSSMDKYQSRVPAFIGAPQYNLHPPSPMKMKPISSVGAPNNLIGEDQMKGELFGQPCFSPCLGGWIGHESHEFLGLERLGGGELAWDYVDQYLVNVDSGSSMMNNSVMYMPEYNMNNLVHGEESTPSNNSVTLPPKASNSDKQDLQKVQ